MARRRMAEGGEAKRSCPPPTEAEQAQERRADEARRAAATRAQRSPKQPKPRRLERKAAAGARRSRSSADWSGKLPPKPFSAPCRPSSCLCALFHVEHLFCIVPRETFCIVPRETFSYIITNCSTWNIIYC